jgi:hypothetical protein
MTLRGHPVLLRHTLFAGKQSRVLQLSSTPVRLIKFRGKVGKEPISYGLRKLHREIPSLIVPVQC